MKQYSTHCEWDHKMNEYKINEIFLHTDGKVYQCMEGLKVRVKGVHLDVDGNVPVGLVPGMKEKMVSMLSTF